MNRLIRTEWLKLATTRGPWAVITGVIALTALITPFAMADIGQGSASRAADAREALAIGPGFLSALMLLLIGALAAAGEFHHRSIVSTYLITPRRGRVLAAKLIAHATLGAVVSAIGVAISFPIVLLMARGQDLTVASNGHLVAVALAMVAVGALSAVCGVRDGHHSRVDRCGRGGAGCLGGGVGHGGNGRADRARPDPYGLPGQRAVGTDPARLKRRAVGYSGLRQQVRHVGFHRSR